MDYDKSCKGIQDYFLREEDTKRKEKEQTCYFNIGEHVVYEGRVYEVLENLLHGMCKCKDMETGRLYSLQCVDLKPYNNLK